MLYTLRMLFRFTILTCVAIFVSCGDDDSLAEFDGGAVLQDEYIEHFLLSTKYKPEEYPTEDNLRDIVTLKAMEKIAVLEAEQRNLAATSLYEGMSSRTKRKVLYYRYMRREMIDAVVTDSVMQAYYKVFSPQYHMRYIMRPILKSNTEAFALAQEDTIQMVYKLLQAGHKFEDLVAKYSQDISTNKKGGDIGFVIKESLGDAMQRAVMDTMKDFSYSKPFRGYNGYFILYKGEAREVTVPSFEQARTRIWNSVYRTRRHEIQDLVDKRFKMVSDMYHYDIQKDVIESIKAKAGGNAKTHVFAELNFDNLDNKDMELDVATYDGGSIKIAELFENKKRAPSVMHDFNELLQSIAEQHLFAKHAYEVGLVDEPEIQKQFAEAHASHMRTILYQREVKNRVPVLLESFLRAETGVMNASELGEYKLRKSSELERGLKSDFELAMKSKYNFKYKTDNFKNALAAAKAKKVAAVRDKQTREQDNK